AACLDRAGADLEAVGALRRRADGEPRLEHVEARARIAAPLGRGARPDDGDGHARCPGGGARRPDPLPRGRPDRQGSSRVDRCGSARCDAGSERTMISVALKGLLGRKTRAILTALAIVLGTGMASATFIFTDTLNHAFDGVFSAPYEQSSVVVSGKQIVTGAANTPSVPASLVARIRTVAGVEAASGGFLFATVKLVGANGKAIGNGGPQFGFGADSADKRFTPLALTTGRWPSGPAEIAIGAVTAAKEHCAVGDTIGAKRTGRAHHHTLTGPAEIPGVRYSRPTLAACAAIGALASLCGLVLGRGLFHALESLFWGFPQAWTVLSAQTVVVAIGLGTGITLVAGLFPALRATRVPAIAAVREGAELPV